MDKNFHHSELGKHFLINTKQVNTSELAFLNKLNISLCSSWQSNPPPQIDLFYGPILNGLCWCILSFKIPRSLIISVSIMRPSILHMTLDLIDFFPKLTIF